MKVNSRNFKLGLLLKPSRISFNTLNVPDLEEKNVADTVSYPLNSHSFPSCFTEPQFQLVLRQLGASGEMATPKAQ